MDNQPQDNRAPAIAGRYLTPEQAGRIAGVTRQCVRAYCRRFGIGEFVAGRWFIDPERFDAFMASRREGGHAQG